MTQAGTTDTRNLRPYMWLARIQKAKANFANLQSIGNFGVARKSKLLLSVHARGEWNQNGCSGSLHSLLIEVLNQVFQKDLKFIVREGVLLT